MKITKQEAHLPENPSGEIIIPALAHEVVEQIAFEARTNEFVDHKSGVSARLSISAYENYHSSIEWRMLMNRESRAVARIADLDAVIPAITGKVELVYEGEQEGPTEVARQLLGSAVRNVFLNYFPSPEKRKSGKEGKVTDPYESILGYFESGKTIDLGNHESESSLRAKLAAVSGLEKFVVKHAQPRDEDEKYFMMEWVLHALANFSRISRKVGAQGSQKFGDFLTSVFNTGQS
jgi:magnesium chelatase subunit I